MRTSVPPALCIFDEESPRLSLFKESARRHSTPVEFINAAASDADVSMAANRAEVIFLASPALPPAFPGAATSLRFIQRLTCGPGSLNVLALNRSGVQVADVSEAVMDWVAEYTVGLMVAAVTGEAPVDRPAVTKLATGSQMTVALKGRLIGIVGLGRVGQTVARRLRVTGVTCNYSERRTATPGIVDELGLRRQSLDRILTISDLVTFHVPAGPTAQPLVQARELRMFQPGAWLVNTGDSAVIDTNSLADALDRGFLQGAALDYEFGTTRSFTTPGLASECPEAHASAVRFALENLHRFERGEPPRSRVEILDLPPAGETSYWSSVMYPRSRS